MRTGSGVQSLQRREGQSPADLIGFGRFHELRFLVRSLQTQSMNALDVETDATQRVFNWAQIGWQVEHGTSAHH